MKSSEVLMTNREQKAERNAGNTFSHELSELHVLSRPLIGLPGFDSSTELRLENIVFQDVISCFSFPKLVVSSVLTSSYKTAQRGSVMFRPGEFKGHGDPLCPVRGGCFTSRMSSFRTTLH